MEDCVTIPYDHHVLPPYPYPPLTFRSSPAALSLSSFALSRRYTTDSNDEDPPDCAPFSSLRTHCTADPFELATKYAIGGASPDAFASLHKTRKLPPSNLTTALHFEDGGSISSLGNHPLDRWFNSNDDPYAAFIDSRGRNLPALTWMLPVRERISSRCFPTHDLQLRRRTTLRGGAAGASFVPGGSDAQLRPIDASERSQAKPRLIPAGKALAEKSGYPTSGIVQSAPANEQSSSHRGGNFNSNSGGNANKSTPQKGSEKATQSNGPQGGGDDAGKGSKERPPSGRSTGKKSSIKKNLYFCVLNAVGIGGDHRCGRRFSHVARLYDHLQVVHQYDNDLYLAEPESEERTALDPRRGLCKVCFEPFDSVEELKDHVEEHHQRARAEGKPRARVDNQHGCELKFTVILLLFGLRQPLADIIVEHAIPFPKVAITPASQQAAATITSHSVPSTRGEEPVHTPPSSINITTFKRSTSPLPLSHSDVDRHKRRKASASASASSSRSIEYSPQAPSLVAHSTLLPTESSISSHNIIDPELEDIIVRNLAPPSAAQQGLDNARKLIAADPPAIAVSDTSIEDYVSHNLHLPLNTNPPILLPPADSGTPLGAAGVFVELGTNVHRSVPEPMYMPNLAKILPNGTTVTPIGLTSEPLGDGRLRISYAPQADFTRKETSNEVTELTIGPPTVQVKHSLVMAIQEEAFLISRAVL